MQQLYLMSSFRGEGVAKLVMNDIEQKLRKPADEVRILYITTAGNLHPKDQRTWIDEGREILWTRGWQVFDYDIANKTKQEIETALEDKDVVFVQGGQCIYMLEQIKKCDFGSIIRNALSQGILYMGESTGSIIAGQDISPYRFLSKDRRKNPPELDDYDGLGLVNFLIRPHWNNQEKRQSYIENINDHIDQFFSISQPMIFLNDNQLVYVEGDKFQIWEG